MSAKTLAGPRAPEALKVTLRAGQSGVDMRNVSACTLSVQRPGGDTVSWPTTLGAATAGEVLATHVFDALGEEAALAGGYVITPTVTVSGTPRRCAPFKMHLVPYPTP